MSADREFISLSAAQTPLFIGVDLGGTNIKFGLVDDAGRSLAWKSIRTDATRGPDDGVRRMAEAVAAILAEVGATADQVVRVGLGSPGTMDIPAGMLLDPPNLPSWNDYPIRDRLSAACGLPVTFSNDANAAAYGEYWVGSGTHFNSMVMFTLGTGIGCGIIIDHMILEGENSHGAECGHMIVDYADDAPVCSCGQPGHLEAFASAKSVIRRTHEALDTGRRSSINDRIANGAAVTPLLVAEEAEKGDELALELVLDTARIIGVGAVNLMHTIDPNGVVLGGAMTFGGHETELGRRFLHRVREEVKRRTFPVLAEKTVIDFAALGGDAGYIGAAGVARLEHRKRHSA